MRRLEEELWELDEDFDDEEEGDAGEDEEI
jgi:hypothetical protein